MQKSLEDFLQKEKSSRSIEWKKTNVILNQTVKKEPVIADDFPEDCFVCEEGILSPKIETVDRSYPDGTVVTLDAQIYYCNKCNHRIPPNEVDEAFTDEYNRLKKIPTIEEVAITIKKICTQTSLSTEEIASCLGWGKKTFYRWKQHIPSRPYWDILLFIEENPELITKSRDRGARWLCEEKSKMSTNRVFSEKNVSETGNTPVWERSTSAFALFTF